ncbi:MAG: efflux transporter periplasmic adaptor subunit, partial [Xenophilus sp.]
MPEPARPDPAPEPSAHAAPSPIRPPSRRRRWAGALVAVLVLGALAGASYHLVKRPAAEGRDGFAGGPGGGLGPVTVGHATAA